MSEKATIPVRGTAAWASTMLPLLALAALNGSVLAAAADTPVEARQGLRVKVVRLVGDFNVDPPTGERVPERSPVHLFRGRLQPFEQPDPRHPALVKILQPGNDGRCEVALAPGEYTLVLDIGGKLYLNNWLADGSWAIAEVLPGQWSDYTIENVLEQPATRSPLARQGPFAAPPPAAATVPAENPHVTDIKAVCRHGQTFVTWRDAADGEAGTRFRYSLYRSDAPITADNLAQAELCYPGVPNNSCKQFGHAFRMKDRLDPAKPTAVVEEGGQPLAMWTGLAVRTVKRDGRSYYAVMVTDDKHQPVGKIVPGASATLQATEEKVAPIQPIRIFSASDGTRITGTSGLPLQVSLHGSQGTGGAVGNNGDVYLYFGTPEMGWRDGLPGIFCVYEQTGKRLLLASRDAIENPRGDGVVETCWFGYYCIPVGAAHSEPRAYPFTENRIEWMLKWTIARYQVDPLRVYSVGQSMGGMAATQFSWRRPDLFAAVYPRLTRFQQSWLPSVAPWLPNSINLGRWNKPAPMHDGQSDYFKDRMFAPKFALENHGNLPFYGCCAGRKDWVDTWQHAIDMVKALTASHHGFAFSWNNGGHDSEGARAMEPINKYYPASKFARNRSFPAFGNSSIDQNMGNGDKADGDLVGGINLGFDWKDVVDEADKWATCISNELARAEMTVDVTPRWCQRFKPVAGEKFRWVNSAGGQGEVAADPWGVVTVEQVTIKPGAGTVLTIAR